MKWFWKIVDIGLVVLWVLAMLAGLTVLAWGAEVSLAWDASADHARLSHYRVHYGLASGNYAFGTNAGLDLTQRVEVPWPAEWFFAVTAVATNGLESDFSNEVRWRTPLGAPWLQGEAFVRLQPVLERSTNLVEWHAMEAAPTWVPATNQMEFFRSAGLRIEPVRVVSGDE